MSGMSNYNLIVHTNIQNLEECTQFMQDKNPNYKKTPRLNCEVKILSEWSCQNKLKLNNSKTWCMVL